MGARRVLILCEPGLLAQGLQRLIESDSELEIVGITGDAVYARSLIEELKPDVLLVDETRFPMRLRLDQDRGALDGVPRLVTMHESDNQIRVYHIEEHALTTPGELIDALRA